MLKDLHGRALDADVFMRATLAQVMTTIIIITMMARPPLQLVTNAAWRADATWQGSRSTDLRALAALTCALS